MARVYSKTLWEHEAAFAGIVNGPGPSVGNIWVVRDISYMSNFEDAGSACQGFWLYDDAVSTILRVGFPEITAWNAHHRELRQVVVDHLNVEAFDNQWSIRVMGYELTTP
jgi:hypothetical protein